MNNFWETFNKTEHIDLLKESNIRLKSWKEKVKILSPIKGLLQEEDY